VRDPNPLLVPRIHCVTAIPVSSEKVCDVIPRGMSIRPNMKV